MNPSYMSDKLNFNDPSTEKHDLSAGKAPMNFTRKRVLVACEFCRHRKRRCDGARPTCSTCLESNADCVYKEHPSDRVESSSPSAVAERLSRIEALLEEQSQRLEDIAQGTVGPTRAPSTASFAPSTSSQPNRFALPPLNVSPQMLAASPSLSNRSMAPEPMDAHLDQAQFLIPQDHSTSANSLLCYPNIRGLLGDFPKDYFFTIEERLPLPSHLNLLAEGPENWPSLPDPPVLETLARRYFANVHPHFPLFSPQSFHDWQADLFENGPQNTLETAICLGVYALGCLVSLDEATATPELQNDRDNLALQLFRPCLRIILNGSLWDFRPAVLTCQALLLCSSYLAHMGRPLHSWRLVYQASTKFMTIQDQRKRAGLAQATDDDSLRVFWSCFMIECDRAAELEIARSGIEPMADRIPLPRSLDETEHDDIHYFVAEIAIRRILNRIHCSLYAVDTSADTAPESSPLKNNLSLNSLLTVSSELNRQLEEWYNSIPARIRPPIGTGHIANDRGKILRIRYYAAKHIIHRPFILYVALQQGRGSPMMGTTPTVSTPQPQPFPAPRMVLDKCETCISSCQTYLYNVVEMLGKRSPYLWTFSQSSLACLLVLMVAESSPQLRPIVPDVKSLQAMVIPKLRRWATKGSSFEAEVKILESMARRDTSRDISMGLSGSLS
ncbi:hypothetical protein GQ53DRAFT_533229 [Thozetella sp. PMI_491]|nr:hypothetical protein GQ53DRAFT_533229 [Thozetella sp. PMI_491]